MKFGRSTGREMLTILVYCLFLSTLCLASSRNKNDMSLHQYSESGEVVQVSYASQAVQKSPIGLIGFSDQECSVLFAVQKKPSSLQITKKNILIEKFSKTLGVAMSGYSADNEYARSKYNLLKQTHVLRLGETPLINNIAKSMSRWLTRGMYIGDKDTVLRPVATAIVLFGRDSVDSNHRMTVVENSGSVKECSFVSLGNIPGGATTAEKIKKLTQMRINHLMNDDGSDVDKKRNLKRKILDISTILFDAAESIFADNQNADQNAENDGKNAENSTENGTENSTGMSENSTENNADSRASIDIECSVCDSSGLYFSSFSTPEKLFRIMKEGWLDDEGFSVFAKPI